MQLYDHNLCIVAKNCSAFPWIIKSCWEIWIFGGKKFLKPSDTPITLYLIVFLVPKIYAYTFIRSDIIFSATFLGKLQIVIYSNKFIKGDLPSCFCVICTSLVPIYMLT